jgi:hypothetical protein
VGARALVYVCMCVALPVQHYLKNGTIFDKMFLNIKCVLSFDINVKTASYEVPVILVEFPENLNFHHRFSRMAQMSCLITINSG